MAKERIIAGSDVTRALGYAPLGTLDGADASNALATPPGGAPMTLSAIAAAVKASSTDYQSALAAKADASALARKADLDDTGRVPMSQLPPALATDTEVAAAIAAATSGLAGTADLTAGLATKADVATLNAGLAGKVSTADMAAALAGKADLGANGKVPDAELPSDIVRTSALPGAINAAVSVAVSKLDLSNKADLISGIVPYAELPADLVRQADLATAIASVGNKTPYAPRPPLTAFAQQGWRSNAVLSDGGLTGPLRLIQPSPSSGGFWLGLLTINRTFPGNDYMYKLGQDWICIAAVRPRILANAGMVGLCYMAGFTGGAYGWVAGIGCNSNSATVFTAASVTSGSLGNDLDAGKPALSPFWMANGGIMYLRLHWKISAETAYYDYSYDKQRWYCLGTASARGTFGSYAGGGYSPVAYGICMANTKAASWCDADVLTLETIDDPTGTYDRGIAS